MRGDQHGVAVLVQRRNGDVAHQAQLLAQRLHFAVRHGWQFQPIAAAAAVVDHLGLHRVVGRRDRRQRHHRHVLRQRLQHHADVADRILVDGAAEAVAVQLHFEDVLGGQESVDVFAGQRHLALADAVQQGFQHVRDFAHIGHAKRRGAALDRMGGAEDRVQILGIGGLDIDGQQQPLHFSQQFLGLIEKDLIKLAYIDGHGDTPYSSLRIMTPISR